jgi:UDP-hydrolysing UDP-N-acetyl-D-glucosamine 2-epimerase
MKRKICIVINSRANYARIKSVLIELQNRSDCELQIVVGASGLLFRFGKVVEIIRNDGFKVHREVHSVVEGNEPVVMAKTTGLALIELAQVFLDLKPDIVVTIADRHETLATAIAASYMNILVAHTQGGEITGSIDESVRHACTKLSHLHFPATQKAYKNILQLGEEESRVYLTGCPALDIIESNKNLDVTNILEKYTNQYSKYKNQSYLLVLFHPDTQHYKDSSHKYTNNMVMAECRFRY